MTEHDWLTCGDPQRMIQSLSQSRWTERRGRLFVVECSRRLGPIPDERLRGVIEICERFADGLVDETALICWD